MPELGYRVSGTAHTIATATPGVGKRDYDAVLLDINISSEYHHFELADRLMEQGIPVGAFVTGYDYLVDPRHGNVPVLQKPFLSDDLRISLEELARQHLQHDRFRTLACYWRFYRPVMRVLPIGKRITKQ